MSSFRQHHHHAHTPPTSTPFSPSASSVSTANAVPYFPADPSLKRQHLQALGFPTSSRLTWTHLRAALIAGIGFFTDAYDMAIINIVLLMLGWVYYANQYASVPALTDMSVKLSSLIGIIVGQVVFGWLGDRLGRRRVYGIELSMIIVGTIASCFASNAIRGISVFGMLAVWRFLLGVGIGGDITLSGVIAAEFSHTSRRGMLVASVFAMQGFGIMAASGVTALVLVCCQTMLREDPYNLDYVWRIILAIGIIPACFSLYFRLRIPETPRYLQEQHLQREQGVGRRGASWGEFFAYFAVGHRAKVLIGTSLAWFCADLVFYGTQLNQGTLLRMMGLNDRSDAYQELMRNVLGQLVVAVLGTIPGYLAAVFLVDRLGRRGLQFIGFGVSALLFIGLGVGYWYIIFYSTEAFIALFVLCQFFLAIGPSVTTFMIPAEVFPTRYRTTAFGISAAVGKLGAIASQIGFSQLTDVNGPNMFMDRLMYVFGGVMVLGVIATVLVPESKGKSLEQLEQDMEQGPPPPVPRMQPSQPEHEV